MKNATEASKFPSKDRKTCDLIRVLQFRSSILQWTLNPWLGLCTLLLTCGLPFPFSSFFFDFEFWYWKKIYYDKIGHALTINHTLVSEFDVSLFHFLFFSLTPTNWFYKQKSIPTKPFFKKSISIARLLKHILMCLILWFLSVFPI